MDIKKSLMEVERWSPRIASRLWQLASILRDPQKGVVWNIKRYTDLSLELEHLGTSLSSSMVFQGAEEVMRLFWQRHLNSDIYQIGLSKIEIDFLKPLEEGALLRFEFSEPERLKVINELRRVSEAASEMHVNLLSGRDQLLAKVRMDVHLSLGPKSSRTLEASLR